MHKRKSSVLDGVRSALFSSNGNTSDTANGAAGGAPDKAFADFLFDDEWYAERYPEAALEVHNGAFLTLRAHYEQRGYRAGLRPSALFVPFNYSHEANAQYSESQNTDPITHYLKFGSTRYANPHWLFDERYYLREYPDVAAAVQAHELTSGYHHFLSACTRESRRPHPLFNRHVYREFNSIPERDAHFIHYAQQGAFAEAVTTGLFDAEWYASLAEDAVLHSGSARTFDCLLHHFIRYGALEGRAPVPDFDADYYLRVNDVARRSVEEGTYRSAVDHWIYRGVSSWLNPNGFFSAHYYAEHNPEVLQEIAQLALLGPFEHFLLLGRKRGLRCGPPLFQVPIDEDQAKVAYARRARTSALLSRSRRRPVSVCDRDSRECPDVSVVIPVHNDADYTYHLLSDLVSRKYTSNVEFVVVDDGSTDETRELSKYFPEVVVLRTETNDGFPVACNRGFRASKGRIVIFANNDIEVSPGSIDAIVALFADNPDIGAAGPRIIRMHGRLQEAGGIVYPDGSTAGYGRGDDPDAARYGWVQDVQYCSAAFLAVRRDTLDVVGGFDEGFSPGYYEEVDLCARITALGQRVVVEPSAAVFHFEHAGFSRGRPPTASTTLMHRHRRLFVEKNPSFVSSCSPRLPSSPTRSLGHALTRPSVLVIEDFLPLPFLGSGYPRASRIVHAMNDMGYRVVLYALFRHGSGTWLDARNMLPSMEVHYDDESPKVLEELLTTREFSAVWMCRTHNLERVLDRLGVVRTLRNRPTLVLDTEALASNRTAALRALNAHREATAADPVAVRSELVGAELFDCIVAVSDLERRQIAEAFPKRKVALVGHEARQEANGEAPDFAERSGFLFVGGVHDEISPNYEGLKWFVEEVWPEVRRAESRATLTIAGYWDSRVRRPPFLSGKGVEFLGQVGDLEPLYRRARVFVAPVRYAAGIPIKVQDAASHGLPCVVTQILARQLGIRDGEGAIVASALRRDEFARQALSLYRTPDLWVQVREQALRRVRSEWSPERFVEGIRTALGGDANEHTRNGPHRP